MELEAFSVIGIRSLAGIEEIPVRKPTILTGANDGGKTACIFSLGFLLGGPAPSPSDRTIARPADEPPCGVDTSGRFAEACTTGRFTLTADEQNQLELPGAVLVRRRVGPDQRAIHEVRSEVPEEPRLRNLDDNLPLAELKSRAEALGVAPEGAAGHKSSYLAPLQRLAEGSPRVAEWMQAPRTLIDRLPRLLHFASEEAPSPEGEIRETLRDVYGRLLEDEGLVGPVRRVEETIRERLQEQANDLCSHIRVRCPELTEIEVIPQVSFSGGFGGVQLLTATGQDAGIELRYAGSGRLRRITLAVWEWASGVLARRSPSDRAVIIAYDEPDTHLDYGHQRDLVDLIRNQARLSQVSVIVATHSLNLIDKVDIGDVVHLVLEEGRTRVERLTGSGHEDIDRYLADVSAAMGLRNSVLLHERCFVAVEGPTEAQALPILFRVATGFTLQAAGLALIAGNGNDGALRVARFLNDHGRTVHFVIDADSASAQGSRKLFRPEALHAIGISEDNMHLLGNPNQLEELFTDDQWADTANAAWHRTDGRSWASEDFAPLRGEGSFSQRLNQMVRQNSEQAPRAKPGYLLAVAHRTADAEDVPDQLREVFASLQRAADAR